MQTYSASELVKNFSEVEKSVQKSQSIYLKHPVNCAKIFEELTTDVENKLDEADNFVKNNSKRLTHDEVFGNLRRNINV